jgi:hypothetical protein
LMLPAVAVNVTLVAVVTVEIVAVKLALDAPPGTVTEAGTATSVVLLLDSETAKPPVGAAAFKLTVQPSVAAPVMERLVQVRLVSTETPVPLRLTTVAAPVDELLVSVNVPDATPAATGSNTTVSVAVCVGFSVSGNVVPAKLNPEPLMAAALTVNGAFPVELSVTVCASDVLTASLPKLRLAALTPRVAAYAFSDKAKVFELLEVEAVSVAVCAVVTAVAVAVKPAVVAPAAISTDPGTVTAALLLARFTLMPPAGALPLTVTVHTSVPAPVRELDVHVSDDTVGRIAIVPVPLSPIAMVPFPVALLVRVNVPDDAPFVVGSNCTVTEAD